MQRNRIVLKTAIYGRRPGALTAVALVMYTNVN